jgi:Transport and Golgi organisation 2
METGFRYWREEQSERSCANLVDDALAELATMFGRCAIVSVDGLMCTVSFLPKSQGFYVAMNRDEKLDRSTALTPVIGDIESRRVVFPREPSGGTWISANDAGLCLALINWHRVADPASGGQLLPKERNRPAAIEARSSWATQPVEITGCPSGAERVAREPQNDVVSRGEIVRALAGKSDANEIAQAMAKLPLRKLHPFRLIAIISSEKLVIEWRWNLERLTMRNQEWQRQHWFSSGFDERRAELERQRVCDAAHAEQSTSSLNWLRRLHCSHAPARGPFSICMHRSDAATVSYTEIAVSKRRATVRYKPGPCCSGGTTVTRTISLARTL